MTNRDAKETRVPPHLLKIPLADSNSIWRSEIFTLRVKIANLCYFSTPIFWQLGSLLKQRETMTPLNVSTSDQPTLLVSELARQGGRQTVTLCVYNKTRIIAMLGRFLWIWSTPTSSQSQLHNWMNGLERARCYLRSIRMNEIWKGGPLVAWELSFWVNVYQCQFVGQNCPLNLAPALVDSF